MQTANQILLIEDDRDLVDVLEERLVREGFGVDKAFDGAVGYARVKAQQPSLVLLDLMLPGMRGMDVCRKLKEDHSTRHIPVIMLTANADEADIVAGLEIGADDYITKPFSVRQLIARVRTILRRTGAHEAENVSNRIELGPVTIDLAAHEVKLHEQEIQLTESEFRLFLLLVRRAGNVVTRQELLQLLADEDQQLVERNVDVHIGTLRKKLGRYGRIIVTIRSLGYKCMRAEQITA